MNKNIYKKSAINTISLQISSLTKLKKSIGDPFYNAVNYSIYSHDCK